MKDQKEPTEILEMIRELKIAFTYVQEFEIAMIILDIEKKYQNKIKK